MKIALYNPCTYSLSHFGVFTGSWKDVRWFLRDHADLWFSKNPNFQASFFVAWEGTNLATIAVCPPAGFSGLSKTHRRILRELLVPHGLIQLEGARETV